MNGIRRAAHGWRISAYGAVRARVWILGITLVATAVLGGATAQGAGVARRIQRVSVTAASAQADGSSLFPVADSSGRYTAFQTSAAALAPGAASAPAIVVRDSQNGAVSVISNGWDGSPANGNCVSPSISADGRYVAFASAADNLDPGDTNRSWDVFVRDRTTGELSLVSSSTAGGFGNDDSYAPRISADGRWVVFTSTASNLVGGDIGSHADVFIRDLLLKTTRRVSEAAGGTEADGDSGSPSVNSDGSKVAFASKATNLVAGLAAGTDNVFVRDLAPGGLVSAVSVSSAGTAGNLSSYAPSIDAAGTRVAFESLASNLVDADVNDARDVFLRDLSAHTTRLVSVSASGVQGDAESRDPAISPDGKNVLFSSHASRLVPGDPAGVSDVFLADVASGSITRISERPDGGQANGASSGASFAGDASRVLFHSDASDLVAGDTNGTSDIFAFDWVAVLDPPTPVTPTGPRVYDRVAGPDRYTTAIEASRRAFPDGAGVVIIASGGTWPDALGGSALAGSLGGPLLLTKSGALPDSVRQEIGRLSARKAVILGGTTSVSPAVEAALKSMLGAGNVSRLGGPNRYDTAALIGAEVTRLRGARFDGTVLVATGGNYPDALAGSPVAAYAGRPIVLVNPTTKAFSLPAGTRRAVILGGPASVAPVVETRLRSMLGGNVLRLGGANRYQAAATIAQWGVDDVHLKWDGATIATGEKFPDALSGGVMAARFGSVVLLTTTAALSDPAQAKLAANAASIHTLRVVGGPASVSAGTFAQIKRTVGN